VKRKRILPPTYLLTAIVAMVALHFLLPIRKVIPAPFNYLGVVPMLLGGGISTWASNIFNKAGTTVKPFEDSSRLVTEGPYRFSRHPNYLGMVVLLAGLAALLGSITPPAVIPAFVWLITRKFISVEEKAMAEAFPEAYRRYSERVRRWI